MSSEKQIIDREPSELAPEYEPDLGNLLAEGATHEIRTLLQVAMRPGWSYRAQDLTSLLIEIQGEHPVLTSRRRLTFEMAPTGAIIDTRVDQEAQIKYEKPASRAVHGDGLGGHVLELALRHPEVTLRQLFGAPHWPRKGITAINASEGAPIRRAMIMMELYARPENIRKRDLAESSAIADDVLKPHLESLHKSGLISYESTPADQPYTTYRILKADTPFKIPRGYTTLGERAVAELAAVGQPVGARELGERLVRAHGYDPDFLKRELSSVLRTLVRLEVLASDTFGDRVQSKVSLVDWQRELFGEVTNIVANVAAGNADFLAEGKEKARSIVTNPEAVTTLIAQCRQASNFVNVIPAEALRAEITRILEDQTGSSQSLSTTQVYNLARQRFPRLSRQAALRELHVLAKDKSAHSRRKGKQRFWAQRV